MMAAVAENKDAVSAAEEDKDVAAAAEEDDDDFDSRQQRCDGCGGERR